MAKEGVTLSIFAEDFIYIWKKTIDPAKILRNELSDIIKDRNLIQKFSTFLYINET